MLQNYYKLCIQLTLLFIQQTRAFENSTAGACKSLISSASTTYTCKYDNNTLDNCINPTEGIEVFVVCNQFYEASNMEGNNQSRSCTRNGWDIPPPECIAVCGLKPIKDISNTSSDKNFLLDYPWHIGIYNNTKHFLCGGTILDLKIILTAANCVADYASKDLQQMILVASGKYYIGFDDKRDKFAQISEVQSIEIPDEYKGNATFFEFNIAILLLKDPFLPSVAVKPICVDFNRLPHNVIFGNEGVIPGWGSSYTTESKAFSDVLKEIPVLYIPKDKCATKIQAQFVKYITPDKICEQNLNNKTTVCNGDNGGGLVYESHRTNRFYIIGVVSWTPRTDERTLICDPNQFSLYTSISSHRSFLRNFTENNQTIHSCHFPDFQPQSKYVLTIPSDINGSLVDETPTPGSPVPPYSELTLICNDGYSPIIQHSDQLYCSIYGHWNQIQGGCGRTNTTGQLSPTVTTSSFNYNYVNLIVAIAVLLVIALIAVIMFRVKFKKEREIRREMKLIGLNNFQYGDLKKFNPELDIGTQAELLPYNYFYEFPLDKLELGKQLGSGAFGVVMIAYAFGITPNEEKTKVAVKTVKDVADNVQIKSLISELKIMVHIGQHLNVVNLLGACTENITKRKLFVIVEYCPFGNLCNYLLCNRPNYIDQIDSCTGNINYSFGIEDVEENSSVSYNESNSAPNTHYKKSLTLRSYKYSKKSKKNFKPLYTKDLISWSFQIARGMDYLSSRKIIHGDLAARNVLLAEDNVVKICDFGLSKGVYLTSNYKSPKDCPLPFKWMPVESIRDLVFSTQSDVWSYGIVLWEIFSLAQTPYPGMEADERLYNKLLEGYIMDSPPYAPKEIYEIMCDCWNMDPQLRPSFNKLASLVGIMLEENVRQHYIDLNDPYLVMNTERLKAGQRDYLTMLSRDSYKQNSVSQNYINMNILNDETSKMFDEKHSYVPEDTSDRISIDKEVDFYIESVHL